MKYLYGEFTDKQIDDTVTSMHNDIHRLLLYKDRDIAESIFESDEDFLNYFSNLLFRFGGFNKLLGEPRQMVQLMSTLQGAYNEVQREHFRYYLFRKAILDSHGYIKEMLENLEMEE